MKPCLFMLVVVALLSLLGCGGGTAASTGTMTPPAPVTYSIGGSISGLSGTGLVLQDNGGNNLTVNASQTSFTFTSPVPSGTSYSVTILTQPSGPQPCVVSSGSGTANANIASVRVACSAASAHNEWTWMNGASISNQNGVYGTQGTAAPANVPGARSSAVSWTDASGNLWLFGGAGYDSNGTNGYLSDLWKYSAGQWTWISGPNVANQSGNYGTLGVPDPGNSPRARWGAVGWADASGNLWLFGGFGVSPGYPGFLNDLWKYSGGEWTWMSGSAGWNQVGTYGTLGVAAPGNVPLARDGAVGWTDASGSLWLFGGLGYYYLPGPAAAWVNDLWKYSGGEWTWMGGSSGYDQLATYGNLGNPAPGNVPGARDGVVALTDPSGNVWLFGGLGYSSSTGAEPLSDLWKYIGGEWTWVSGPNIGEQAGTYGTLGTPASSNVPGARSGSVGWTDASGNLWLFGGSGLATACCLDDNLNDLWKYSGGEWIWLSGSNLGNQAGTYGTLGTAAPNNIPGGRSGAVSWIDASGNFWLFGGLNAGSTLQSFSDLWMYEP